MFLLGGVSLTAQELLGPAQNSVNYSIEKEAALGKQLAEDLHQRTTSIDKPDIRTYVEGLGQRIAASLPEARVPFTFSVIADDLCPTIQEPTALPGGYIFIPAALLLAARDEAEFAGILAHAMVHVSRRHGAKTATATTAFATIPLIFMGGSPCSVGWAIPSGYSALHRANELEADSSAVQTMAEAGFDPMALVRYVERVQPQQNNMGQSTFQSLPDRDQRVANMRSIISTLPSAKYVAPSEWFTTIQEELRKIKDRSTRPRVPPTLKRSGERE
jgi:predicted Zn-dependent protease